MLSAIGREFSRQLSEYKQFKVNLLFANLGIFFLVTGFLNYFEQSARYFWAVYIAFYLVFFYHSITHPTYLSKMRLQTVPLSTWFRVGGVSLACFLSKLSYRFCWTWSRAFPLFCLVTLVQQIAFPSDWVDTFVTFLLSFVALYPFMVWAFSLPVFPLSLQKFPALLASLLTGFSFWLVLRSNRVIWLLLYLVSCLFISWWVLSANQVGSFFYYYWDTVWFTGFWVTCAFKLVWPMPKRREVCSMYNEVKRFYLFRKRRWADTLFDTLYHVIFILGFYSLLRGNSDFQLTYFYYYSSWPMWFLGKWRVGVRDSVWAIFWHPVCFAISV